MNGGVSSEFPVFSYAGRYSSDKPTALHLHHAVELVLVTSGQCVTYFDGVPYEGNPGTLHVIPPDTPHIQYNQGHAETTYVVFEFNSADFDSSLRCIDVGHDRMIRQWMADLYDLFHDMDSESCDGLLYSLLRRIARLEQSRLGHKLKHPALANALRYIRKNFTREISVTEVASQAAVSTSHLKTLFYQGVGISPRNYILKRRMAYARQLLLNPYIAISAIASMCGIANPNYFSRLFKKYHGCTPGEFRSRVAGDPLAFQQKGITEVCSQEDAS
jgi:AraC-like DNA-binding protein